MKTRSGFVSNSSSSSFIILGERLNWYDLAKTKGEVWMVGVPCGEGYDVFKLTKEMIDFIVKTGRDGSYYLAYKTIYSEEEVQMKRDDLPPVFTIFEFDKSHHSCDSMDTFMERYLDNENA